jgi:hypothetical protein
MPDNRRTTNKPGEFIPGVNFKDVEYTIVLVTGGLIHYTAVTLNISKPLLAMAIYC